MYSSKFVSPSTDWTCVVCARNREWASEQSKSKPTNTGNYYNRWILNRRIVCTAKRTHITHRTRHLDTGCVRCLGYIRSFAINTIANERRIIYLFSYFVLCKATERHALALNEWVSEQEKRNPNGWMEESGQNATNHKYQPENFPLRNRRLISVHRCGVCSVCICIWFNYNFLHLHLININTNF